MITFFNSIQTWPNSFIVYMRKLEPRDAEKPTENHTAIGLQSHFYGFSRKKKSLPLHGWFLVSSQLSVLESLLKNKKETLTRSSLKND